jgi:hypothetical protein
MQTVTLRLPEETLRRYQRSAAAVHKGVEEFIIERLEEAAPPLADDAPLSVQEALQHLESLDDEALWAVAKSKLPPNQQRRYTRLLNKNSQGTLKPEEQETLATLGEEARRLTLLKAHAFMLLKWRGHTLPPSSFSPTSPAMDRPFPLE